MSVVFTIKESGGGLWRIERNAVPVHSGLRFGAAIRLGRQLARDEYAAAGLSTRVDMVTSELTVILGQYARPDEVPQAAVA
jgi:hypothetical protein